MSSLPGDTEFTAQLLDPFRMLGIADPEQVGEEDAVDEDDSGNGDPGGHRISPG